MWHLGEMLRCKKCCCGMEEYKRDGKIMKMAHGAIIPICTGIKMAIQKGSGGI